MTTTRFAFARLVGVLCTGFAVFAAGALSPTGLNAQDATANRDAAFKLLPQNPLVFVQAPAPSALADYLLEHPVRTRVEGMKAYGTAMESDGYRKFLGGLALVQSQLGKSWQEALDSLAGGGVYFVFDPKHAGVCVLARATDAKFATRTRDQLVNWAKFANKQSVKSSDYHGVEILQGDKEGAAAVWDGWIAITNKPKMLQAMLDRHRDGGASLKDNDRFQKAMPPLDESVRAWAYVDVKQLRDAGEAKELFAGQAENPAAEILFGGIMSTLQHTDHLIGKLQAKGQHLRLSASMPHRHEWAAGPREHFFGVKGQGQAKELVKSEGSILSISAYRDIARMWLQADDLFSPEMVDSLAEADSNLTTFFGGRDFGEDILGSLKPEVQFLVSRQSFASLPRPALKLPGFSLVGTLKDPVAMQRDLKRTFQNLIGFLNIVGAMEGNPQFDMDSEMVGDAKLYTAKYVPEPEEAKSEAAKIFFNFSPCIGFRGERVVISSSLEVARKLVVAEEGRPLSANTHAVLLGDASLAALQDNRNQLIAQNMLESGHTRAEAEAEITTALEFASLIQSLDLKLTAKDLLQIDLTAEFTK